MASDYIRDTADQLDCAAVEYATNWDEAYAHRLRRRHEQERER
jgi:hypothetical protein